jgi:hypothetical protein
MAFWTLHVFVQNYKKIYLVSNATQLYIAISQFEIARSKDQNFEPAIKSLENIVESKSSKKDDARWYSAMIYLKSNDIEKAKPHLQILAKKPESEREKWAEEILKQLE